MAVLRRIVQRPAAVVENFCLPQNDITETKKTVLKYKRHQLEIGCERLLADMEPISGCAETNRPAAVVETFRRVQNYLTKAKKGLSRIQTTSDVDLVLGMGPAYLIAR